MSKIEMYSKNKINLYEGQKKGEVKTNARFNSPIMTSLCSEEEECSAERGFGKSTANTCLVPLLSGNK